MPDARSMLAEGRRTTINTTLRLWTPRPRNVPYSWDVRDEGWFVDCEASSCRASRCCPFFYPMNPRVRAMPDSSSYTESGRPSHKKTEIRNQAQGLGYRMLHFVLSPTAKPVQGSLVAALVAGVSWDQASPRKGEGVIYSSSSGPVAPRLSTFS